MRHAARALFLASLFVCAPIAQTPEPLAFEVASIKPNKSGSPRSGSRLQPRGRYEGTNLTVHQLIVESLGVRPFQVIDGPAWIRSERFDITARTPDDAPPNRMRDMLRTLLADRFGLVVHTEMREQAIFALVLARSEPRPPAGLIPTGCEGRRCGLNSTGSSGVGTMWASAETMTHLAEWLSNQTDRLVIDRTGLTDTYDFYLRYGLDSARASLPADAPPSLFTALSEQLGLKLESSRGPVAFTVIDRVDRPSAN